MKPTYRHGIFLVVYSKDKEKIRYLILKRKLHWKGWEFPKGGLKSSETKIHGLKRELKEESGKTPIRSKKFNISGRYRYKKKLKDREGFIGQTYMLYAIQVKGGRIKIDRLEHSGYKWLEFKDAVKKLTWPNQKKSLRIVNEWLMKKK